MGKIKKEREGKEKAAWNKNWSTHRLERDNHVPCMAKQASLYPAAAILDAIVGWSNG